MFTVFAAVLLAAAVVAVGGNVTAVPHNATLQPPSAPHNATEPPTPAPLPGGHEVCTKQCDPSLWPNIGRHALETNRACAPRCDDNYALCMSPWLDLVNGTDPVTQQVLNAVQLCLRLRMWCYTYEAEAIVVPWKQSAATLPPTCLSWSHYIRSRLLEVSLGLSKDNFTQSPLHESCLAALCGLLTSISPGACSLYYGAVSDYVCSFEAPLTEPSMTGTLTVQGGDWHHVLRNDLERGKLLAAVMDDVAASFVLPFQFSVNLVEVLLMRAGSLVVEFRAFPNATEDRLDEMTQFFDVETTDPVEKVMKERLRLTSLKRLYAHMGYNVSDVSLGAFAVSKVLASTSEDSAFCSGGCIAGIVVGAVGFVALVAVIVYVACGRRNAKRFDHNIEAVPTHYAVRYAAPTD